MFEKTLQFAPAISRLNLSTDFAGLVPTFIGIHADCTVRIYYTCDAVSKMLLQSPLIRKIGG